MYPKAKYSFIWVIAMICMCTCPLYAQLRYGNEWIDFNKTYLKFKVGKDGIYRISKTALDNAGVPASVKAENFILYRNGKEIAIRASATGSLGPADYIEFYGYPADGLLDKELYLDTAKHPNDNRCLFTDSAAYFLTYDDKASHLRITPVATVIPAPLPAPVPYCRATNSFYGSKNLARGRNTYEKGLFTDNNTFLYSPEFEQGEGFIDDWISPASSALTVTIPAPNLVTGSMLATVRTASIALSYDSLHRLRLYFNGKQVADSTYGKADIAKFNFQVAASSLVSANKLRFAHYNTAFPFDQYGLAFWEIDYPRDFDVSGLKYFRFTLESSTAYRLLEFNNFSHSGKAPLLYNLDGNELYYGDISAAGKTRFYIRPSATDARYVLISDENAIVTNLQPAYSRTFTDYSAGTNQGNYIIVSHNALRVASDGQDYLEQYKSYRSSADGGGYRVVVADVPELYDQFAFGTENHPLSVKRFLRYALETWSSKPEYTFLIGKGIEYAYLRKFDSIHSVLPYRNFVPSYGAPPSDVAYVNDRSDWKMKMAIGRLSAWNGDEVRDYLGKVKDYEQALKPSAFPTHETELWKKKVLHVGGSDGGTINLQRDWIIPGLRSCASIIERSAYGGIVTTALKSNKGLPTTIEDQKIDSLLSDGLGLVTYYGHASSSSFDYNLKSPFNYQSAPRLPLFAAFGCDITNIFEVLSSKTFTENYISYRLGGSIGFISSNNYGFAEVHSDYMKILYHYIGSGRYGQTIGKQYVAAHDSMLHVGIPEQPSATSVRLTHMECLILQCDPALKMAMSATRPDYFISNETVVPVPVNVTTALDSFHFSIQIYNLGKSLTDSVELKVIHTDPQKGQSEVYSGKIPGVASEATFILSVPINKQTDMGLNKYAIQIDPQNKFEELSESNNSISVDVYIYSDNVTPIYPPDCGIVNNQDITLKASTLNVFQGRKRYLMELDTTELFNSAQKQQYATTNRGGVIKWKPGIVLRDSTVYYWRCAIDTLVNGSYVWTGSSFIYLANGQTGWNQSHHFQLKKNTIDSLLYGEDRKFRYTDEPISFEVRSAIMGLPAPFTDYKSDDNKVMKNNVDVQRYGCYYDGSIQVMVFDSAFLKPWENPPSGTQGSIPRCPNVTRNIYCFEFPMNTSAGRNNARKFIDSIPEGNYVLVRSNILLSLWNGSYVNTWKADTLIYGSGKSLYHSVYNLGFNKIDSFNRLRTFTFFCRKGVKSFSPIQYMTTDTNERMQEVFVIDGWGTRGKMISRQVGPATAWKRLQWKTSSVLDTFYHSDMSTLTIRGIDGNGDKIVLYNGGARDTDISFINAALYHNIELEWYCTDTFRHTPSRLDYWRVTYDMLPEAALNPVLRYEMKDSIYAGQMLTFRTAVESLNEVPMDSMRVLLKIIDENSVAHVIADKKYNPLRGNDTIQVAYDMDPRGYTGKNLLFVEVNAGQAQPEQYHPNNFGYIPFYVRKDNQNPLLDVTFDGVHILDKDIISSRPLIRILLKDENKYLDVNDTGLFSIYIRYPNDPVNAKRKIPFDGSICRLTGAGIQTGKNEAIVEYKPSFTEDGIYQLYVNGKDATGNEAGAGNEYRISFEVINKATITNLLNYPNPFSTSTSFVFTLTGSEIPSQFKIQILTVTGKVVREITKEELGRIRIGRNMTEYKWDGRDQYGQLLGNGVYLYRVVTTINGSDLERRASGADKFYKNGYGKMYIMR